MHEKRAERLVLDRFLFSEKALLEEKASGLQLHFNIFPKSSTWHAIKKIA